jgi:hypothetical protein
MAERDAFEAAWARARFDGEADLVSTLGETVVLELVTWCTGRIVAHAERS